MARVSEDTVGFAMMEVIRTALGCAGARDPAHRIRDGAALDRYQRVVVGLARRCLLGRHAAGMRVLRDELTTKLDLAAL